MPVGGAEPSVVERGQGRRRGQHRCLGGCNIRVDRAGGAGQVKTHRGSDAAFAFDFDVTARLFGETVNHAQAQAAAFARTLGGEERLENPPDDPRGMPTPVSRTPTMT